MAEIVITSGILAMAWLFAREDKKERLMSTKRPFATRAAKRPSKQATTQENQDTRTWGDGSQRIMNADIQPFYKGRIPPGNKYGESSRILEKYTGAKSRDIQNAEAGSAPLFQPKNNLAYTTGMPSNIEFDRNTNQINSMMKSSHRTGERLFQPEVVAPGIGISSQQDPSLARGHGYHEMNRLLPKSVNELRPGNDPKLTYDARIMAPGGGISRRVENISSIRGKLIPEGREHVATGGGAQLAGTLHAKPELTLQRTQRGNTVNVRQGSAPPIYMGGEINRNSEIAPVKRQEYDAFATGNSNPISSTLGNTNTTAIASDPKKKQLESRVAGAPGDANMGIRSYQDVYAATLNQVRDNPAPEPSTGLAVVPAQDQRLSRAGGVQLDRAHVLISRTQQGGTDGSRQNNDVYGSKTRDRRGVETFGTIQSGATNVSSMPTNQNYYKKENVTYATHNMLELDVADSQLNNNPINVSITG